MWFWNLIKFNAFIDIVCLVTIGTLLLKVHSLEKRLEEWKISSKEKQ